MSPAKTLRRQETHVGATRQKYGESPLSLRLGVLAGKKVCEGLTLLIVLIIGLLSGCTGWQRLPDEKDVSPEAQAIIDHLAGQNTTLTQFKGLGTYRLKRPQGLFSGRMGWACIRPDRLRTEILDFSGRPFATIASDGQRLYARIQGEKKIHRKRDTEAVIQRIIGTPVPVKEVIAFLSGRVPIRAHQRAYVSPDGDQGLVLRLTGKWNRLVEEIHLHKKNRSLRRVAIYSNSGNPVYEVEVGPSVNRDGYSFFQTLAFRDNDKNGLDITLEQLWLVEDMPLSIFEIDK